MNDSARQDSPGRHASPTGRSRPSLTGVLFLLRSLPLDASHVDQFALDNEDHALVARTEAHGIFGNRVEDRLKVGLRSADDFQDLRGRGLPVERFLGFVEQAHVLDRDHSLLSTCPAASVLWPEPLRVRRRGAAALPGQPAPREPAAEPWMQWSSSLPPSFRR